MSVLSPEITRRVIEAVNVDQTSLSNRGLSEREMDVLHCLAKGKTTSQVSTDLFISENTVKIHLRNILDKLHLQNRIQAAVYAVRQGLVDQNER